jgi:hypothetical protein
MWNNNRQNEARTLQGNSSLAIVLCREINKSLHQLLAQKEKGDPIEKVVTAARTHTYKVDAEMLRESIDGQILAIHSYVAE